MLPFRRTIALPALLCALMLWPRGGFGAPAVTPSMTGTPGLNVVPSARMDDPGTVRLHAAALSPYVHGAMGMQLSRRLYVGVRQTAKTGSLAGRADRLYPGLDLKFLLLEETGARPAVAAGVQGAGGRERMAGEYVALSKRWRAFDFTGGIGWGRMGSAGDFANPLAHLAGHFGSPRGGQEDSAGPAGWFTGGRAALFGGVSWDTPIDGLTLKADWSGDRFRPEKEDSGHDPPSPWSFGFSYSPRAWVDFGLAAFGTDRIGGSVSFHAPLSKWPGRAARPGVPLPFPPERGGPAAIPAMEAEADGQDIALRAAMPDPSVVRADLLLRPGLSEPLQIGRAARAIAMHAGRDADAFEIRPRFLGLSAPSVTLMRRDLEQAMAFDTGSPQEIWRHARLSMDAAAPAGPGAQRRNYFGLLLDSKASLSEEDQGALYRAGLVLDYKRMLTGHLLSGQSMRLNLANNLRGLNALRPLALLPVRSDEDLFAARRLGVERSYIGWLQSFGPNVHIALAGGYLEEMYAGAGGEILYRPFGRTFAFGAEAWEALKRDPSVPFNLGLNGDHLLTGHLKAWYEIPGTPLTVEAKAGRYLAEDWGGTLTVTRAFAGGASLQAFATATDMKDSGLFGERGTLYGGLRLTVPLGNVRPLPESSAARLTVAPIGRDAGQSIESPLPLYGMTDALSYRALAEHWNDITE